MKREGKLTLNEENERKTTIFYRIQCWFVWPFVLLHMSEYCLVSYSWTKTGTSIVQNVLFKKQKRKKTDWQKLLKCVRIMPWKLSEKNRFKAVAMHAFDSNRLWALWAHTNNHITYMILNVFFCFLFYDTKTLHSPLRFVS